jgi:outer membrane protein assembly factor BamB
MPNPTVATIAFLVMFLAPVFAWTQSDQPRSFPSFAAPKDAAKEAALRYPLQWDPSKVTWKANLEGYGQSCPLVLGEKMIVTSVVGPNKETYKVTCLDLKAGGLLWERETESSFPAESTPMVSRAAPTPIGDENGIYVFFESGDFVSYDMDGKLRWQRSLQKEINKFENKFGLSSSPAQTETKVFLLMDHAGESCLVGIDKESGNSAWVTPRGKRSNSWSSPAIVHVEGEPLVVCSSTGSIDAYSPSTGKLLCTYNQVGGNSVATPYDLGNGRFLVGSLIRPADGPSENATISNLSARISKQNGQYTLTSEWIAKDARGSFCSPVEHNGYCYWLNPQGVLFCLDSKTGEEFYAKRPACGACWATPFAVGDRLYLFGKEGEISVIKIGKEFEELSRGNRIWDKDAVSGDDSPRSRMSGHTLYAAVPIDDGFVFRRGDIVYRLGNR